MPIFEYICQECNHEFEALVFGRDKAKCPKCESKKLSPQLSVFATSVKGSAAAPASPEVVVPVAILEARALVRLAISIKGCIFSCFAKLSAPSFR